MNTQKLEIGAPCGDAEGKLPSSFAGASSTIIGFVTKGVASYIRYRTFKRAEKELHALDDRMLNDIGLDRSEITSSLINAANERRNGWRV